MSGNVGLKVSPPGVEVTTAPPQKLVVDTDFPFAKCDLRKNPKNYGILNITVAAITTTSKIIYQQQHGYGYVPSFLTAWTYPGTNPLSANGNSTFGVGDIDATNQIVSGPNQYGPYISMYCDNINFYIAAISAGSGAATVNNTVFSVRFYIFADDFSGS